MNRVLTTGRCWMMAFWVLPFFGSPALAQSGGLDTTFKPVFDSDVFATWVQPDRKLLVIGFFTKVGSASRRGIARLNADGSVDAAFNPGTGASTTNALPHTVETLALQRDGRIVLGGRFQKFNDVTRSYLARLNSDGFLDTTYIPVVDAPSDVIVVVAAMAIQPDGKILIGGEFYSVNGTPCNHIARLNPDGSLDTNFAIAIGSGLNASVQTFGVQSDGRIVIGGQFTSVNGASRVRLARLNSDGSLDTTFDPGPGADKTVNSLTLQPDGKVVIGGDFSSIGGVTRIYVARLNGNGSLDTAFTPNFLRVFGGVLAVQTEVDGKVLVGGDFTSVDGMPRANLARLNPGGSLDTNFNIGTGPTAASSRDPNPRVRGISIQADGKALVGGGFTRFNGANVDFIARLLADQGGTVEFASANYSVDESGGNAAIAVRRTGSTNGTVAVNYLTSGGTATAGADYVAQAGALLFGPGETNKAFTVPISPDALVEPNETVTLALGNPIGGVILGTNQTATLTIIDNTNSVPNSAPVLPAQINQTINEMTTLIVTNAANDADVPANVLTYRLESSPAGASIDTNGVVSWTPSEAQGPSTNPINTVVTDNGVPPMSATNRFTVIVQEVNSAPVLPVQTNQTINEMTALIVTNMASDADVPANVLTYRLESPPAGAMIAANGVVSWTPSEAQGPSTNPISTVVTDNGVPPMSATNRFTVIVQEVNSAPVLSPISDQIALAGTRLTVTNSATDPDVPANILTFTLVPVAPAGATIDPATGEFTWTPPSNQPPSTTVVTVLVTDNSVPSQSDTQSFSITVPSAPVILSVTVSGGNVTINWSAVAGGTYRVQFKQDLNSSTWNDLAEDVISTESTAMKTDTSASGDQRFYQVVLLP